MLARSLERNMRPASVARIYIYMHDACGALAAHVRRGVAITEQAEEVFCATAAEVCGAVAPSRTGVLLAAHRHPWRPENEEMAK